MIVEVMGRSAGWIAMHAGLASGADIILIPEKPTTIEAVCDAIVSRHDRGKDFSIVVVAEGARVAMGNGAGPKEYTQDSEVDEFGHVRLGGVGSVIAREIEAHTGYQTRVTVLGHIQRWRHAHGVRPRAGHPVWDQGGGAGYQRRLRQDGCPASQRHRRGAACRRHGPAANGSRRFL